MALKKLSLVGEIRFSSDTEAQAIEHACHAHGRPGFDPLYPKWSPKHCPEKFLRAESGVTPWTLHSIEKRKESLHISFGNHLIAEASWVDSPPLPPKSSLTEPQYRISPGPEHLHMVPVSPSSSELAVIPALSYPSWSVCNTASYWYMHTHTSSAHTCEKHTCSWIQENEENRITEGCDFFAVRLEVTLLLSHIFLLAQISSYLFMGDTYAQGLHLVLHLGITPSTGLKRTYRCLGLNAGQHLQHKCPTILWLWLLRFF